MAAVSFPLPPILIPPGIYKNSTPIELKGYYVDGDKVRFRDGKAQKMGGWVQEYLSSSIIGTPRAALAWQGLDLVKYIGVGTNSHLHIITGGTTYDITPFRVTANLNNVLSTTIGTSNVKVTHSLHGAEVGDFVYVSPSVTYNGVTLFGSYEILTVVDQNNYILIGSGTASSTAGPAGGAITINYLLESGLVDAGNSGFGWGAGDYGEGTWGTPRTSGGTFEDVRLWALNLWGDDLMALPVGGSLYFWDRSGGVGTRAQVVATAPERSNWMLVASSRQVILFGTETMSGDYDPLLIRWSDTEDYTDWDLTLDTNTAGEYRITKGTKIISAIETTNGEILVFTDAATYRMIPTNTDYIFNVELIADNVGIIAPNACIDVGGIVYWMAPEGLRMYDGTVRVLPTTLDLFYFDSNADGYFNATQKSKIFLAYNREFNEIWTFIPDKDNVEINRYLIYNIKENVAYDGYLQRTAWIPAQVYDKPYAFNRAANMFSHEQGKNDSGAVMDSFISSSFYDISEDGAIMMVDRIVPDGTFVGAIELELTSKKFPQSQETFTKEYIFTATDAQVPVRVRGRFISITIRSNSYSGDYRIGKFFAGMQADGFR